MIKVSFHNFLMTFVGCLDPFGDIGQFVKFLVALLSLEEVFLCMAMTTFIRIIRCIIA